MNVALTTASFLGSMLIFLAIGIAAFGGTAQTLAKLNAVNGYMDWFPHDLPAPGALGAVLFAASWLFAGFSVVGQPHIMVRFMALDQPRHIVSARWWYYVWFVLFYGMATGVGLLSRIFLAHSGSFDVELALDGPHNVFDLVVFAWSGLASAFAPLLIVYALGGRPTQIVALTMLGVGLAVAIIWRLQGLQQQIYEGAPGILAGLATYIVSRATAPGTQTVSR